MIPYTTRGTCRSCESPNLEPILSLGETPLANALVTNLDEPDERVPLDLVVCRTCTLVQITEEVPPEILFRDYVYFSSFSDTILENARALAGRLVAERKPALVMEIASNDGYLLQNYVAQGVRVLGIEPARNIAEAARAKGIDTVDEFFTRELAQTLPKADIVHANNVLAHVPDLNGFIAGIATVLNDGGIASIEVPYVRELIERLEFDTIYHEHLCYFSVTALDALFQRHGLTIGSVEQLPIHGGSLRIFAGRGMRRESSVTRLIEEERDISYRHFAERVRILCDELRDTLAGLKRDGHSIAAYGASAKGTTLLTFARVGADMLDFVADRSTVKQGKRTPGTRIPIVVPEELVARMPDYVLLLAWNFADEIIRQQREYHERGGKFILPLPVVKVV